jgi:phage tail sheath gpL-like
VVSFSQISPTRRIPLFVAEFSASPQAPVADFVNPSIVLAQKTPAASAVVGQRYRISMEGQAADLFGAGSPAHLMCRAFLAQHPTGTLYCAAQTDATDATAASTTLTFTGPSTAAGTLFLYVGGVLVEVGVTSGMTAAQIATAVAAAINAATALPVTAAAADGVVTVTCKVEGTVGNQVAVAVNALGPAAGQQLPAGVGVTIPSSYTTAQGGIVAMLASGATDPTASAWGTSLGDDAFDDIAFQSDNTTAVDALRTTLAARWNANSAKDGRLYIAKGDSSADLLTYYAARNDERLSVMSFPELAGQLTPAFEIAAAYAGVAARELANDPAAPIQMLPLVGVWPLFANFSDTDRNGLAYDGGATMVVQGSSVFVEFEGTTRRKDEYNARDTSAEDIQIPAIRSRIRRRLGAATRAAYPRHKLATDDTPIAGGQRIVTPRLYAAFLVARAEEMARDGLIEDLDAFKAGLLVERDENNPNRLNSYITPNAINRARVFAMNIAMGG